MQKAAHFVSKVLGGICRSTGLFQAADPRQPAQQEEVNSNNNNPNAETSSDGTPSSPSSSMTRANNSQNQKDKSKKNTMKKQLSKRKGSKNSIVVVRGVGDDDEEDEEKSEASDYDVDTQLPSTQTKNITGSGVRDARLPTANAHFFVLEMHIGPGGGRSAFSFCGTFVEVVDCLLRMMNKDVFNLHLQLSYGQDVLISEYHASGLKVKTTNMLDFIEFRFFNVVGWQTTMSEDEKARIEDAEMLVREIRERGSSSTVAVPASQEGTSAASSVQQEQQRLSGALDLVLTPKGHEIDQLPHPTYDDYLTGRPMRVLHGATFEELQPDPRDEGVRGGGGDVYLGCPLDQFLWDLPGDDQAWFHFKGYITNIPPVAPAGQQAQPQGPVNIDDGVPSDHPLAAQWPALMELLTTHTTAAAAAAGPSTTTVLQRRPLLGEVLRYHSHYMDREADIVYGHVLSEEEFPEEPVALSEFLESGFQV